MNKNVLLKCALFVALLACGVTESLACMYGPPYRTVCRTFADADTVITGKIESVVSEDAEQRVSIAVEKTYKGEKQKRIVLNQPLSTCDRDFSTEIGQTLLLYLVRDQKTREYSVISEGMGGRIERESENLYWLDNLPRSLTRTRVSGTLSVYNDEPFELLRYVAGAKIRIFNDKNSFDVSTDKNGVYEIWDIPAGKYRIQPAVPADLRLSFNLERGSVDFDTLRKTNDVLIEIEPKGCGGLDFITSEKAAKQ